MRRSIRSRPGAVALLCLAPVALLSGCGGSERRAGTRGELQTVDVSAAPDADATTELDVVATPRAASVGVLPADFPKTIPLPAGGSLVDFGEGAAGSWIELVVAAPPDEVSAEYRRRLSRGGFRESGGGVWARGSLRLKVAVAARAAGATVRLEPVAR
ncbi:MAG: hypothetical protein H6511_03765 [Holophagales bacterium]|nr:hypothetical protein [Holophagales bacterium]